MQLNISNRKQVYLIPGLGASSRIFEYLKFSNYFEVHYLDWISPLSNKEELASYAKRMAKSITGENIILIGVSFGGIIAQEIARLQHIEKVILISSIKSKHELPWRLKWIKYSRLYYLSPLLSYIKFDSKELSVPGKLLKRKVYLYARYMSMKDKLYLLWATRQMLFWKAEKTETPIFHIHGTKDQIFPVNNLSDFIEIKDGSHAMILTKARKISKIINKIIIENDH
ncbi:alpha/beta fold hydrolase [Namhaeicola litoreus]|uniref:Alpha/beta fold hydrolase n=1 Tax=Namhaeicola litoreus TaxID=1052145 RepID=A0ABW3Y385_9FLAO